jgi:hypothetical protein
MGVTQIKGIFPVPAIVSPERAVVVPFRGLVHRNDIMLPSFQDTVLDLATYRGIFNQGFK